MVLTIGLFALAASLRATETTLPVLQFETTDRILILAPHPDDEVLGCGGVIQRAVSNSLPVRVVFLTHGDNNQWSFTVYRKRPVLLPGSVRRMGEVRRAEALAAGRELRLRPEQLKFLGYPDFGILKIWTSAWGEQPAVRSMLTRVRAVPYADAYRPGAPYRGDEIVHDLAAIIEEFRPTKIFVSHASDHNPDHRALYMFTRVALWEPTVTLQPELFPYLIHFARWPRPRAYRPDLMLEPPPSLAEQARWQVSPVSPAMNAAKLAALKLHRTQFGYAGRYLQSFARATELFGDYPVGELRPNGPLALQPRSAGAARPPDEPPEELTDAERTAFVGLEWEFIRWEGDSLVMAIHLSRPLAGTVEASLYAFGWRADQPFGVMPKLHIRIGEQSYAVYDQGRKQKRETIGVQRDVKGLTVQIPWSALGHPQRLFTSARTFMGDVPLDWAAWRVIALRGSAP